MSLIDRVTSHFIESIEIKKQCMEILPAEIVNVAKIIVESLMNDGKILACGNGGSAADAQHFSAELVGRFEKERMGLPAIALTTDTSIITAISNDYDYELVFSKQISALGKKNDILLAISTSGNSSSIVNAVSVAHEREMQVIALTGKKGGKIADYLNGNDILINVPHERTARIQEVHILIIHALCDMIDQLLFGDVIS